MIETPIEFITDEWVQQITDTVNDISKRLEKLEKRFACNCQEHTIPGCSWHCPEHGRQYT